MNVRIISIRTLRSRFIYITCFNILTSRRFFLGHTKVWSNLTVIKIIKEKIESLLEGCMIIHIIIEVRKQIFRLLTICLEKIIL